MYAHIHACVHTCMHTYIYIYTHALILRIGFRCLEKSSKTTLPGTSIVPSIQATSGGVLNMGDLQGIRSGGKSCKNTQVCNQRMNRVLPCFAVVRLACADAARHGYNCKRTSSCANNNMFRASPAENMVLLRHA